MTLTDLVRMSEVGREVQTMMGQEDLSGGRKLPWSQNLELIWLHSGLREPGHQNQFSGEEVERISMSLDP